MADIRQRYTQFMDALSGHPLEILLIKAVVVLAAIVLSWIVLKWLVRVIERRLIKYPFIQEHRKIFGVIEKLGSYALVLVAGTYFIQLFDIQAFSKPFYALLIILVATPVKNFLLVLNTYLNKHVAAKTSTKVDDIVFDLLNRLISIIVYCTAAILALDFLGVNVLPFIASAGVIGIAVGFAAKDTLSNLIAGVLLLVDRPFEVGDRIQLWQAPPGGSSWGDVVNIGLRGTKIKTTDNIIVVIPNNSIMTRDIINYTANDSIIRVRINIGVAYDTDIEKAKKLIIDVAATAEWILSSPAPKVVVRNFGESAIDMQLRVWIADARRRMDTISFITDHVKTVFGKKGIEIPYPKREIRIINETPAPPTTDPNDA